MRRRILAGMLTAGALLFLALPAFALESENFTYALSGDGTVIITGYTGPGGSVEIPSALDGRTVTGIGTEAFLGCHHLTSVSIPAGVTSVGAFAFYGCSGLRHAFFHGNAPVMWSFVFTDCAPAFTVHADSGKAGFTYPQWYGYRVSPCTDADHDGYYIQGGACGPVDCNDNDSAVHPRAPETCNGIDDDCDGTPDDGLPFAYYYPDRDDDGYGSPANAGRLYACEEPEGYVDNSTGFDCNDNDSSVNPDALDVNCNGVDENCDNETDEGYEDYETSCGIGACARTGWTVCPDGAVEPVEICFAGMPASSDETCDGIDDDCDGAVDEEYGPQPTGCGVGACASEGITLCVSGEVQNTCVPGRPASDANCNGIDEDCDGMADDDYASTATTCGAGACAGNTGTTACINGSVVDSCNPLAGATADTTCNGIDEDCNGIADDAYVPEPTHCGIGACAATGQTFCAGGAVQYFCAAGMPASDANCNGIDDDCDGVADDGYKVEPTSCGAGACAATGISACVDGMVRENCTAGSPSVETCNGIDDDCDGTVDNGLVQSTYYRDADGDLYGNAFKSVDACDGPPEGYVESLTLDNGTAVFDCDDSDALLQTGCPAAACSLQIAPRRIFRKLVFLDPLVPFTVSAARESGTVFAPPISIDWGTEAINDIIRSRIGPRVIIGFLLVRPLELETGEFEVTVTFGEGGSCAGTIEVL